MPRGLQREVRVTLVPVTWLGRLLAGVVGIGVLVLGILFFMVLLAAVGVAGLGFMIYTLNAQRRAQRGASDVVIEGEYTVESSGKENNDKITGTRSGTSGF